MVNKKMDSETAMAFAGDAFEKRHPRSTWPEWLRKCVVPCYTKLANGNYVVSFAVTLKETRDTETLFRVEVNSSTAETTVLVDESFDKYLADQLASS